MYYEIERLQFHIKPNLHMDLCIDFGKKTTVFGIQVISCNLNKMTVFRFTLKTLKLPLKLK